MNESSGDILDVLCIGETLIDFISVNEASSLEQVERFHRSLGGSPANIAVQVACLGGRAAIASKVGAGAFGRFCRAGLERAGVETTYLVMDPAVHTTVVFVSRTAGTPDFEVFRAGDAGLNASEVPAEALRRARAVHASTFALSREPCRSAVISLLEMAAGQGLVVSLDPNYHPSIWPDRDEALGFLGRLLPSITVTKPSLDDARRLFGPGYQAEEYLDRFHAIGARSVVLTMGGEGVWLSTPEARTVLPPRHFTVENATGAGDAFWAGYLLALLDGQPVEVCGRFAQESVRRRLTGDVRRISATERRLAYETLT